ncbi:MAG: hypothetical protein MPL62_06960 [Alphaproteobacteria bacterium]|nr:hypothetical protein [Alphaproteobacteria bacterium]
MASWYETAWFCEDCLGRLTYEQKMGSHGRCPLCGFKGEHAGTIVDVLERPVHCERVRKIFRVWWWPWPIARTVVVRRIEGDPRREGVPVTVQVLEPRKLPPS